MSVSTWLYMHTQWSLDTTNNTTLLDMAYMYNYVWLVYLPMVPNSQLGGLRSPARAKSPAQSDTANELWQHWYSNPGTQSYM